MQKNIVRTYRLKIKVLSPVHIGSGKEYYPYEYCFIGDKICIYDFDSFLAKSSSQEILNSIFKEIGKPLWKMLSQSQLRYEFCRNVEEISAFTANNLKNWAEKGNRATIWEFIKNSFNQPYIPGSSLKGAIRTAIAYSILKQHFPLYKEVKEAILIKENDRLKHGDKEIIEKKVFCKVEPQKDVMRIWAISDSGPISRENSLSVIACKRLSKDRLLGFSNYFEVLTENSPEIYSTLSFYPSLINSGIWKKEILELFPKTIDELLNYIRIFSTDIVDYEIKYYKKHPLMRELSSIINFYTEIAKELAKGAIILPIGKGTGWISKTIGLLLKKELSTFNGIFKAYKLGKKGQRPEIFPSSREIICESTKKVFGWIKLEIK
ncbi:MAG: type III-A CRISPR-associated RAMP protein Csm5 [Candidatus Altiarchaeota archaeon]